ncbi:MAG TPA: Holliday junction resolvase RuvX [Thiothrix sp.]|nr:Holliday junction resolvase RuvX [Thiothrix sp.]
MTVLAFDFGLARTGVAIGNTITGVVTPLCTLISINTKPDWNSISKLIEEWRPQTLVVGMPYLLDGTHSEMTEKAAKFSRQLEGRYSLPVDTINEQLSSMEAEQRLKQSRQAGRKKKIKKEEIDQLAAAIILESWIMKNA